MIKNLRLRLLSNVVIFYMLVAFTWWTVLLYTKNQDAFNAKAQYMQLVMAAEGAIKNTHEFHHTAAYQDLYKKYIRQEWMILGEAIVFIISLVIGVYLINRGYNKEMIAAQDRRNFLLSITHELKSPIASIRLVLDTLIKRQLKPDQINRLSHTALEETERLTNLVEDLLLAAKVETSYQPVLERFDFKALIDDLLEKLKTKFPHARFSFAASGDLPPILADKTGITSITLNLLENAIKYSPKEAIDIGVRLINQEGQFYLDIADKGIGISEKEKKKIFQKFYRVGNEDTRQTKGTGLGLYIVSEIIKAHLGSIEVTDNPPKGTLFKIRLPQNSSVSTS
ncbi:MAG: HAMP domain-containing sensor histidine kinase [Bacteroidota bacterium]